MTKQNKLPKKVWCIAYINRDKLELVETELRRYGYKVEAYIPTVKILKKKFKNKDVFEETPLLFNYGFFRLKYNDACNPDFLMELRSRITCIYAWVKDPISNLSKLGKLRMDNHNFIKAMPASAICTDQEVANLVKEAEKSSVFSADEINRLSKGDYITLKGYPFDDMPAKIISINKSNKTVRVKLLTEGIFDKVTLAFENVFYTVYQGYDDSLTKGDNYDEMIANKHKTNKVDKMIFENYGE
jgi:transcription antitermination factor NusG